ncbi:acetyltransferase [Vibrio cholerae]|nr:acetyltransferase [Vibrio cholerae]ELH0879377.1 acetyltransferase [Vibrio cholerae]MDV2362281.1 acetyltransferase [Vibrio cholerae]HBC2130283.1 acetyltransferase [Vibrio cholerae]HDL9480157.1 acetyltransferase [Vibrio cholerae]HDZ3723480.1 acetyltransferase [Vibrio cholerae]
MVAVVVFEFSVMRCQPLRRALTDCALELTIQKQLVMLSCEQFT